MKQNSQQRPPVGSGSPVVKDGSQPLFTKEEMAQVVSQVSQVLPAGNVPDVILSGLLRMGERKLQHENVSSDLASLLRGVEKTMDKAAYLGYFAGPAAAIWAYQQLLRAAGKEVDDAFPEGVWQFYVGYGLREDTARHTNETHGFDTALEQHDIHLDEIERMAAWVMAGIICLHQYDEFLATEWKERTATCLLRRLTQGQRWETYFADLYQQWGEQKPYSREEDASDNETYPVYRWNRFRRFVQGSVRALPPKLAEKWRQEMTYLEQEHLPRYQQQMSILTTLVPGPFEETRQPIPLEDAHIGVIYRGEYFLIPICEPDTHEMTSIETVVNLLAGMVSQTPSEPQPVSLTPLARTHRAALTQLTPKLSAPFVESLQPLATAPILLNFDPRDRTLPLAEIRQTERGLGSHPLTVFTTRGQEEATGEMSGRSFIFDQSHIFFDGAWGAAFAEIFTNEALSWALYLHKFPPAHDPSTLPTHLKFPPTPDDDALMQNSAKCTVEAAAETRQINIRGMVQLRKLFKMRSDLLHLTVNDMLVLYRAIHALTYQPSVDLVHQLRELSAQPEMEAAAQAALRAMTEKSRINPTVLIPVDASVCDPRERVHPLSFEVPLSQLDLLGLHARTVDALNEYDQGVRAAYTRFDELQRQYLLTLASLGEVFFQAKSVAILGQTTSVHSLKMLAHFPPPLQKLLDAYTGRVGWMNDMLKGREVFSNIGRVVYTSTLTRFLTAKDDNDHKDLAWGILTDKEDKMFVTLRDFRPHVAALAMVGQQALADAIAQDYLNRYAQGLNQFLVDLHRITVASRETKLSSRAGRNILQRKTP